MLIPITEIVYREIIEKLLRNQKSYYYILLHISRQFKEKI